MINLAMRYKSSSSILARNFNCRGSIDHYFIIWWFCYKVCGIYEMLLVEIKKMRLGTSMKAKKLSLLILVSGILSFAFTAASWAEDYKIGVVNVQKVLTSIPQTEAATNKLTKEFGSRDRAIGKDNKELEGLADRLKKDGAIMSDAERVRVERDITTKQRDLKRKAEEFQEDLNFRRNEEMQAIQKKIAANVRDYAKENAYDFILVNSAVYFSDKVNITGAIVERMKKVAQ